MDKPTEITPEMLEAGAMALFEAVPECIGHDAAAKAVYEAMERARLAQYPGLSTTADAKYQHVKYGYAITPDGVKRL